MFPAPVRLTVALRSNIPAGVFAATAVSTVVFASTPFLIPAVATDRGVDIGIVGTISTAQLAGFVLASMVAPRRLTPRRTVMVAAIMLGSVANAASALVPTFTTLVGVRFLAGVSLGLIAWIAWAEVFGDDDRVGDVAVIGPLVGTVASPIVSSIADHRGPDELFVVLAVLHLVPVLFVRGMKLHSTQRPRHRRHRPTPAAAAVLTALGLLTFGGSAAFVYVAAIGTDVVGMAPFAVSLALSANAIAGLPSARWRGPRPLSGAWMAVTAVAAVAVCTVHHPVVFWVGLSAWGCAFWMCVPGAFSLLAERSVYPAERAGDAQAVMAAGRVAGPVVGGALFEAGPRLLGLGAGALVLTGATIAIVTEIRGRPTSVPARVG